MRTSCLTALLVASLSLPAQGSQAVEEVRSLSAAPARELTQLMEQRKLDAIAAADANEESRYAAALVYPGTQILAITGTYPVPVLLNERLMRRDDRDTYVELNRASERQGRLFVQDMGGDGIHAVPPDDGRVDVVFVEIDTRLTFDGDWKGQSLSREEYLKRYKDLDNRYAHLLQVLIDAVKARGTP
jgi:hypothetical protein